MTLGEMGVFIRGNGIQKKDFTESGVGCIHYGQVHTHYGTFAHETITRIPESLARKCKMAKTGDLVIATTSEDAEGVCKAVAWLGADDIAVSGDAYIYRHSMNPKFISYIFQTDRFLAHKKKYATGTKVIRMSGSDMGKFMIPVLSREEQDRIVAILDKFEALNNSLTEGLPAEIKARQQQYEYYRDKLLTFKRKEVA